MATNNKPPVQGDVSQVNISVLNIDQPDKLKRLFRTKGDQWLGDFYKMMQLIGLEKPVTQPSFSHFEDDDYERVARIGVGGVAAGAGLNNASIVIPLSTLDVFTNELGAKAIFPLVGDVWIFPNKAGNTNVDLQALVVDTDAAAVPPTITVKLLISTDTTSTGYLEGDVMVKISNASSAGTQQPEGTLRNFREKTFHTQIFKATEKVEGSEATNGKWFDEIDTAGGGVTRNFWSYMQEQMDYTHMANISTAMLFEQQTDTNNITDPYPLATGNPVRTTKGLKPSILGGGGHAETYPIGGFATTKYNRMSQIFEDEKAGGAGLWLYGFPLGVEIEDELVNYNKDTDISYVTGVSTERVFEVGFKQVTKAERTFMMKKLGAFSDRARMGQYADVRNSAFILPLDNRIVYADRAKSDSRSQPTILLRYKELNGYSRRNEMFTINGTHATTKERIISEIDKDSVNTRCEIGFEHVAVNQFIHLQGVAA